MFNNKTIKSDDIIAALYAKHKKDICLDELRLSSGFQLASRVDFWAINIAPSTGNIATSYEVKISRSDFRRDSHKKQRGARLFSDKLYYIAPVDVIPHEEIPDWAGLIEVQWDVKKYVNGGKPYLAFKEVIAAPKLDKEAPSWGLLVSMMRNDRKTRDDG